MQDDERHKRILAAFRMLAEMPLTTASEVVAIAQFRKRWPHLAWDTFSKTKH